jgi:Sulfotransferase domain
MLSRYRNYRNYRKRAASRDDLDDERRVKRDGGVRPAPPAPECPPGWQVGPPDFVGVGVQRGNTRRWFDLITSHPEVAPAPIRKELHFFDRFYAGGYTPADTVAYHKHFPRDGRRRVGEWTPMYLSSPWVPPLLAAAAPETRLLAVLRDPIERLRSGIEFNTVVEQVRGREMSELAPAESFMHGLYHSQLTCLLSHFDRSQLLVLQYERCIGDPLPQLKRTFEFLGLEDTEFVPDLGYHPHRQHSKPALDDVTREAYVTAYRDDVVKLVDAFPELDVKLWPNFAELAAG